jgi:DNA-directed RNA polymerase specialized sigma24 family protein
MTPRAIGSSIKEQLTDPDGSIWLTIAGDILPRVRRELRRRYGIDRRWLSSDDAVLSAFRTLFRRLHAGKASSYPLESLDDLESLLFAIAHRKLISAYRTKQRETRHAPQVVEVRRVLGVDADELSVSLVELIDQLLEVDYERTIFREKMNGSNEQTIAQLLHRESGVPWSKYMVREAWRRFRKRARRQIGALVNEMNSNLSG